jgi:ATP-dependent RNA helicase DDX18/HAS1
VYAFHGAIPAEKRKATLEAFTGDGHGVPRLLVCTDRASRGMDFEEIGHVVLFDFPRDGIEYVRRVGRATRGAQEPGRVTSLVLGRQLAYARELMKVNREGGKISLEP